MKRDNLGVLFFPSKFIFPIASFATLKKHTIIHIPHECTTQLVDGLYFLQGHKNTTPLYCQQCHYPPSLNIAPEVFQALLVTTDCFKTHIYFYVWLQLHG